MQIPTDSTDAVMCTTNKVDISLLTSGKAASLVVMSPPRSHNR